MEVIKKNVDWRNGTVSFDLLNTGFAKGTYQVISPTMTISESVYYGVTYFDVSVADATKYVNFTNPVVQICDAGMRQQWSDVVITDVNTTTGRITTDTTFAADTIGLNWIVTFADYNDATDEQKLYGYIADSDDNLGTADDDAHLIIP